MSGKDEPVLLSPYSAEYALIEGLRLQRSLKLEMLYVALCPVHFT